MSRWVPVAVASLLAACNCADPAVRTAPDASPELGAIVDAATELDAREVVRDAAIEEDTSPVRERDAYLPRDPPPIPPEHACALGTSMRRLHESDTRSMGRSSLGAARWGDGLAITWSESPDHGSWRSYAGRLTDPVAGELDVSSSWLGDGQAFVTMADGRLRVVSPNAYADVSDDGLEPAVELPPRPPGFDRAYAYSYPPCRGAEAVAMLLEDDDGDGDSLSVLRWVDGEPRWFEPAIVPGFEVHLCAAVGDSMYVGRRADGGRFALAQWTAAGALVRNDWSLDARGEYVEGDVAFDADGRATVITAVWSEGDPRFAAYALDDDGPHLLAETTVPSFGSPYHMLGVGTLGDRIVILYNARYLTTLDFDPATATFGAPALVADHPCWSFTNTVTLDSGVYAALECYFEEVWLLRMCGGEP